MAPTAAIPVGQCPKCKYPMEPGICPECGRTWTAPELVVHPFISRRCIVWAAALAVLPMVVAGGIVAICESILTWRTAHLTPGDSRTADSVRDLFHATVPLYGLGVPLCVIVGIAYLMTRQMSREPHPRGVYLLPLMGIVIGVPCWLFGFAMVTATIWKA